MPGPPIDTRGVPHKGSHWHTGQDGCLSALICAEPSLTPTSKEGPQVKAPQDWGSSNPTYRNCKAFSGINRPDPPPGPIAPVLCLGLFEAVAAGWFWRQALRVPCRGQRKQEWGAADGSYWSGEGAVSSVSLLGGRATLHEAGVILPRRGTCGIPQITVE